mgnify:CR=1 FL=1
MVERCRQDKWHCGCIARLLSIEDVLFSVHAKETEMKKLLLGLTALFALSTAVPAYAEDKPADDKAAAEKPAKKKGKKAKKGEAKKDEAKKDEAKKAE